jgi:cytochrome c peroxidase
VGDSVFGMQPQVTRRKPPSYLDAMFAPSIFWDGRAATRFIDPDSGLVAISAGGGLESQAVGPPVSDAEMACEGRTWADIHAKLQTATPLALATDLPPDLAAAVAGGTTYPDLFEAAYGTPEINTRRIAFAIASHERRLTSNATPWDLWNDGDAGAMTPAQVEGLRVFMGKGRCAVCHAPPLFSDLSFHNLGFVNADFDTGRQEVSAAATDRGRFKTPSLRNVGLREAGGLLHNGVGHGATLETVVAAYDLPPNADPNVDSEVRVLGLSDEESKNLVDFLRNALTDPRVRDELPPFDRPKLGSEQ